jgi:hypothetical protein
MYETVRPLATTEKKKKKRPDLQKFQGNLRCHMVVRVCEHKEGNQCGIILSWILDPVLKTRNMLLRESHECGDSSLITHL